MIYNLNNQAIKQTLGYTLDDEQNITTEANLNVAGNANVTGNLNVTEGIKLGDNQSVPGSSIGDIRFSQNQEVADKAGQWILCDGSEVKQADYPEYYEKASYGIKNSEEQFTGKFYCTDNKGTYAYLSEDLPNSRLVINFSTDLINWTTAEIYVVGETWKQNGGTYEITNFHGMSSSQYNVQYSEGDQAWCIICRASIKFKRDGEVNSSTNDTALRAMILTSFNEQQEIQIHTVKKIPDESLNISNWQISSSKTFKIQDNGIDLKGWIYMDGGKIQIDIIAYDQNGDIAKKSSSYTIATSSSIDYVLESIEEDVAIV